jgi:protocatechuate 4,5-dioxygenase beta chain
MGMLVAAIAMTHNPRIFWNAAQADPEDAAAVYAVFDDLRERLRRARPDRLIVVGDDHLDNFFLDTMPAFCVGVADRAGGPFWYEAEIMGIPAYQAAVDAAAGRHLLDVGARRKIDFAQAHEFGLDHAFCVPLSVLRPEADLPIVPVFTNVFAYPLPRTERFYEVGETLAAFVAERPAGERVAIVTSFNLSLDVGGPRMGSRDEVLDRRALELIRGGRVDDILREMTVERLLEAGNSAAEFLNYVVVLGAVGRRPPDLVEYKTVQAWGACPFAAWDLAA